MTPLIIDPAPLVTGLHDQVAALLVAMGDEPATVAAKLRDEQVRGMRGSPLTHPVCRWLARRYPHLEVAIGSDTVLVFRAQSEPAPRAAIVPLPQPVRVFADRFDDGQYPELELSLEAPAVVAGWLDRPLPAPDPATDTVRIAAVPI